MKSRPDRIMFPVITLLIVLVTTFILGEFAVRLIPSYVTRLPVKRVLLFSAPNFELDDRGAVRFAKHSAIREIAVYTNKIEYDVRYHANNLGLLDHRDYYDSLNSRSSAGRRLAFVGDSLTAGSGCGPWVPRLAEKVETAHPDMKIYNLGIPATGLEHFYRLVTSTDRYLHFTDIFVLAISGDFERPFARPLAHGDKLSFCLEDEPDRACLDKRGAIATIIDFNASTDQILQTAMRETGQLKAPGAQALSVDTFVEKARETLKQSKLLTLLVYRLRWLTATPRATEPMEPKDYLIQLKKVRQAFPGCNIHFIHLPEKDEVARNSYRINIGEAVEGLGIRYFPALTVGHWSHALFFENDGHPNCSGYQHIADTVERYLLSSTGSKVTARGKSWN